MSPDQRTQLADLKRRGAYGDAGKRIVALMERIDQRPPLRRSFKAARHARNRELLGAFFLIAACIAAALFL